MTRDPSEQTIGRTRAGTVAALATSGVLDPDRQDLTAIHARIRDQPRSRRNVRDRRQRWRSGEPPTPDSGLLRVSPTSRQPPSWDAPS
jgi:hypothetical protein